MAPPVNQSGHPPDVTAHLVSKETAVICVLKGSREIVARNVPLVSKEMNARNVLLVSKAKNVNNVQRATMELNVVMILAYPSNYLSELLIIIQTQAGNG